MAQLEAAAHPDAVLVARARSGETWAQEAIFRRYAAPLTAFAERLLQRTDEADDVVQDTFADAFESLAGLREPSALRAWLYGIALRRAQRRLRRRGWLRRLGLDRGLDDATLERLTSPFLAPDARAELVRVDAALSGLPHDVRAAWMLRHVEGESLEDIATIVGCSLATAKRRIAAAEASLDRQLDRRRDA